MFIRSNPPADMISNESEFFNGKKLKELPPSPHDFPISGKSLEELIMGFPADDPMAGKTI